MSIKDILQKLDIMSLDEICRLEFMVEIKLEKDLLSNSDKRLLSNHISNFRKLGWKITLKRILAYSFWCPDEAIKVARKKGVFRYKAWGLKENCAEKILHLLKSKCQVLRYSKETCRYINTKLQLSWMFAFYCKSEKELRNYIRKHHNERIRIKVGSTYIEEALFKDLLAYADCTFHFHKKNQIEHLDKNHLSGYGEEEIIDSISYLVFLYDDEIGIKDDCHYLASPEYVLSDDIEKIILIGCKIYQLQEWEVCIDYFDYKVKNTDNKYVIFDEQGVFEKSIKLGYVRRDMQEDLYYMENHSRLKNEAISLSDVCKYSKEKLAGILLSSVGSGKLSRFRFEFPEPFFEMFKNDGNFFEEEYLSIGYCAKEFITTIEEVLQRKITEKCSLLDVVMLQRFFVVLNLVASEILFEQKDKAKVIRSLIPSFNQKTLKNILTTFVGDEAKVKELTDLLTYKKGIKLDLQYTPFLQATNELIFSTALISKSNLLRNCIAHSYLIKNQIVNLDDREPLVLECSDIFTSLHSEYQVFTNKKFTYQGQDGEIDVLVISKTDILIIECKCPLSPTNNFEMRASVDHIEKAAKQLSLSKLALSDSLFRRGFFNNLKIKNAPQKIYTCIVFGNRLFNGYTIQSHPIRYIRELDMILNNGHIYSEAGTWRVWKNECYTHDDLIDFISQDYALADCNFSSMEKVNQFMFIKGRKVIFETYAFNFAKSLKLYDETFFIECTNENLKGQINAAYEDYLNSTR